MEGAEGLKHTIIHKADRIPLITIKSLHQIKVVDYVAGPDRGIVRDTGGKDGFQ